MMFHQLYNSFNMYKSFNMYNSLNIYYEIIEDFILSLTMPGAKNGEVQ